MIVGEVVSSFSGFESLPSLSSSVFESSAFISTSLFVPSSGLDVSILFLESSGVVSLASVSIFSVDVGPDDDEGLPASSSGFAMLVQSIEADFHCKPDPYISQPNVVDLRFESCATGPQWRRG